MRWLCLSLAGAIASAGGLLLVLAEARGEQCTLQIKRLESRSAYTSSMNDYIYRAVYPQRFNLQWQEKTTAGQPTIRFEGREEQDAAFKRVVKKEPEKYNSAHPFRGVAKLGSQEYAFVFDSEPAKPEKEAKPAEKKEAKSQESGLLETLGKALSGTSESPRSSNRPKPVAYARLFFDANHNGDLTDDKVIESEAPPGNYPADYSYRTFPRVDLTLDVDGQKVEYAFTANINSYMMSTDMGYAYASFNAAAYREGEITVDGKKRKVVLIDFNSNGRFDDEIKIRDDVRMASGEVYPTYGDMLLVDPNPAQAVNLNPYDPSSSDNRHYLSKLVSVDGRFYDLKTTAAGDTLTLTPMADSLGYVTNPNDGFTAIVYSDKGFVKIRGGKTAKIGLPEGEWKLLSYTIDWTGQPEPAKKEEKKPEKKEQKDNALLGALTRALGASSPATAIQSLRPTKVSARATRDCKPVKVVKGETTAFPFGPPYKPVVRVDYNQGGGQVRLGMSLVGCVGEQCSDLTVNGGRPGAPEFTISDPKGEVVQTGRFEYG